MYSKQQEKTLEVFADLSDRLFDSGVITTDSFTGEIGEYIACKVFDLKKTNRVTQAVDGISKNGERYQVKAKVAQNNFNYNLTNLESNLFDFLVIVYLDRIYNAIKIIRIPVSKINQNEIRITARNINSFEQIELSRIRIPASTLKNINEFAKAYNNLEASGIIRSRRIVGDIGEFYACRRLNLQMSESKNEKGIDARHENGLTFEIKTRRVYQSGRRNSETRRLNNLADKSADYLIVVTIDRSFKCSGMWLIPIKNLTNPKSANLSIVNNTPGTLNLIPSKIDWLQTGEPFKSFKGKNANSTISGKKIAAKKAGTERSIKKERTKKKQPVKAYSGINNIKENNYLFWIILLFVLLFLYWII